MGSAVVAYAAAKQLFGDEGVVNNNSGWTEGLQLMDIGSKYIFYIPSNLAYGDQVVGSIPPGSTLIFEVELLDILPDKAPQNNGIQVIQR